MRVLLFSYKYAPGVGGMETIAAVLVAQWIRDGHDVTVITHRLGETGGPQPRVLRRPSLVQIWRQARRADVIVHNHVWLRAQLPAWLSRRPRVIAVHSWFDERRPSERLKMASLRTAQVIAVSGALAYHVRHSTPTVVTNCYDDTTFHDRYDVPRDDGIVFVGRLVHEKGADMAIDAVAAVDGLTATIVGDGPERPALEAQAQRLGVSERVEFTGVLQGAELARELNQHEVIVVPSRWGEPFGIVALEGIACGCVAVVSAGGGLPDAVGHAGITFPNNDLPAFIAALEAARSPDVGARLRAAARRHLHAHSPARVATAYLDVAHGRSPTPP
jgi:glycosyltransferase involved in cell wall biosynthesis